MDLLEKQQVSCQGRKLRRRKNIFLCYITDCSFPTSHNTGEREGERERDRQTDRQTETEFNMYMPIIVYLNVYLLNYSDIYLTKQTIYC